CDHNRTSLGKGETVFNAAVSAFAAWQMFPAPWVEADADDGPLAVGTNVAVVAKKFGVWAMFPCRVVYVVKDDGPVRRAGFAYGTLQGHFAQGEERFTIEWHREDDSVWYDIRACSRPRALWAKLFSPLIRRTQRRFARDSLAAMRNAATAASAERT